MNYTYIKHVWCIATLLLAIIPILEGYKEQIFSNAVWNEATIYDFIENDVFFEVVYPEELKYTYRLRQAKDFGVKFKENFRNVRLVVSDPAECCSLPYNSHECEQAIVLVERGECSFVSKAVQAEKAGALAIIVMDKNSENDDMYIEMVDDSTKRNPSIPAGFLLGRSGFWIKRVLSELREETAIINIPVNLTHVPIDKFNQPPWVLI